MKEIIANGEIIALVDEPRYVRLKEASGAYIQCSEEDAEAVAVSGTLYNLPGNTNIKHIVINGEETEEVTAPEAYVREVDGGEVTFQNRVNIENNEVRIAEVDETALTGLMATTDLYEELLSKGVL